jgi:hypothetical protein
VKYIRYIKNKFNSTLDMKQIGDLPSITMALEGELADATTTQAEVEKILRIMSPQDYTMEVLATTIVDEFERYA